MDGSALTLISIVVLLVLNGFFVAAEFALVTAKGFRIEALMNEGSATARMTYRIQQQLEAYIAACQLGITMASLGLGWIGEPAVAALLEPVFHAMGLSEQLLHTLSFIIGFVVFASLHIVVGEQVPKTLAIRKPEPVSLWVAYPLHLFYILTYPLNWALNEATASILSLFKVAQATHADVLTDRELQGLISVSKEHGEIAGEKADMLSNLFAFDARTVGRVMVPKGDVKTLIAQGDPQVNVALMRETQHSRFPVVESAGESPIAMVLSKELFRSMLEGDAEPWTHLSDYYHQPLYVPESLRIGELFDTMRNQRLHMAFVVDEYGDFEGLVTLEDLLEEIVGEIDDETDEHGDPYVIVRIDNGWQVHGLTPIGDVERATGMSVPKDLSVNTLSGLFMNRLGRIPAAGDTLEEFGYRMEVTSVENNHVESLAISVLPAQLSTTEQPPDAPETP